MDERIIEEVETEADIASCFPVMHELRTTLEESAFVPRVRYQMESGYRLARVVASGAVTCVAGFRIVENLAWGRALYVDDLVSASTVRSAGHGAAMLTWLADLARAEGCAQLHLDSGVQRHAAHRFYLRERMNIASFHFSRHL